MSEIKYGQLWARHSKLVQPEAVGNYRITFEGLKRAIEEALRIEQPKTGAVWVRASANDKIRWGMHAARYINDDDGLKYTGAAFVEHHSITFYSHLLGELKFGKHQLDLVNLFLLDESGTAAGREEDACDFAEWMRRNCKSSQNGWVDALGKWDTTKGWYELFKQKEK